jgi:hypothetical protein
MIFLHLCSVNIILLLFIFAAIGYILQDGAKGTFLSTKLYRYVNIMLTIAVISGVWLLSESNFWRLSLPNYQYKIFISIILITVSVLFELFKMQKFAYRSIVTIVLFMIIYSISMYLGSFSNV